MGIDTDGGMIVGEIGSKLTAPEGQEFYEWAEDNGLERMALWYDADVSNCYYGYTVDDVLIDDMDGKWLEEIHGLANKFEDLTGVKPKLIGTQDVW